MSSPTLVLVTSLSPHDERAVQPVAVQSWLSHGAKVLAVNTPEEISTLKVPFPDIEFVETHRTAEQHAGRPVPYIFDLLSAAKENSQEGDTIGIINADIFLRPAQGLKTFLMREATGAVVLGPRVDVIDAGAFHTYLPEPEPTFSIGYDYFIMSRDLTADFADSPFAMGMPFWDYWLPLTAYLAGRPLRALKSPVALHVHHETRWDDTIYLFFHALIAYALEQSKHNVGGDSSLERRLSFFLNVVAHHYGFLFENGTGGGTPDGDTLTALADFYDRFQETAVHTIKNNAEIIHYAPP